MGLRYYLFYSTLKRRPDFTKGVPYPALEKSYFSECAGEPIVV